MNKGRVWESKTARRRLMAALAGCAALALVAGIAPSAHAATAIRFSLNWKADGSNAAFYLMEDRGYFKQEGLDVTLDAGIGSSAVITRIASGAYDAGFGDINTMVQFDAEHPDKEQEAVLVFYDRSPMAVITLKKYGIEKPLDLIGKTIGAPQQDTGYQMFPTFAKKTGIDMSKIKFENVAPNLREPLLVKGDVQAVTGFDSTSWFALKGLGVPRDQVKIFYYADYGLNLYSNSILVSKAFAEKHPAAIKGLVRAVVRGYMAAYKDPKAAIAALVKHEPLTKPDIELEKLHWLFDNQIATAHAKAKGFGTVDPKRLEEGIDVVVSTFHLKRKPTVAEIYTGKFLPPLADRKFP
ncbi:MAG TPA: ABC transporter substrate-binding protein [Alphaproteobacteria bacterium]|nr:ABC transporter substrate-binding protein [Alphaproteobacteria bacterium]